MQVIGSRLILRPTDYQTTLGFYRDVLGLAINREYPGGTVFFAGQGLLEIAAHGERDAASRFSGAIWLQVRDIASAEAELVAAGVRIDRSATQEPWGLIEMWISDPDGTPIVVVEVPADHPLRRDMRH